jgi:hypothetical protein
MVFGGGAHRSGVTAMRWRRGFGATMFSGEVVWKVAGGVLRGALIERRCPEVDAHRSIAVAAQNIGGGWGRS